MQRVLLLGLFALVFSACGSSGGNGQPPAPPAPVTPPPPPPEPTFVERLQDWADMDPNPCRRKTPGFEALGGWLKDDGRELGTSRVWIRDSSELSDTGSHGATVWKTFTDCAVRSDEDHFFTGIPEFWSAVHGDGRDLIQSSSVGGLFDESAYPAPGVWAEYPYHNVEGAERGILDVTRDGNRDGQRVLLVTAAGNEGIDKPTKHLYDGGIQLALQEWERALVIIVGGYHGQPSAATADTGSSVCGDAASLCLFARFDGSNDRRGTSQSSPQVAAALDAVWTVWPDMDVLDLRNLAFDCADNKDPRAGETSTDRTYSYRNGRSFTSSTNPTWGHGILSLTCLFTPNGGLQNPVTGDAISGGIYGPLAGPVTGASITGVDYTGRDFGYGFARPVARENLALVSLALGGRSNLRSEQAIYSAHAPLASHSPYRGVGHARGAYSGRLWQSGALSVDLTAAGTSGGAGGGAIGVAAHLQVGNMTIRGGIATQPEGVGSLTGSRGFRAPATVSAAVTAAYVKPLPHGFSVHVQADHWRTVATYGRSLWESAELAESRLGASVVKRAGPHEFSIQAVWQSGLSGSLGIDGRIWPVAGVRERGVWLTWRSAGIR